jgi:hypothetical protein
LMKIWTFLKIETSNQFVQLNSFVKSFSFMSTKEYKLNVENECDSLS